MRTLLLLLSLGGALLPAQNNLDALLRDFARRPGLEHALVGIDVREVGSGRRVASVQSETACIPASTQKLITTAVAMDVLGADYRFRTRLVAGGQISNGVLDGNLYIVGGGDPTLGSPSMDGVADLDALMARWVTAVRAAGIRRIEGAVVGDGSYYGTDGVASSWPWADLGNYYGAGAYGLNLHENSYFLSFTQRSREGTTPPVSGTEPSIPGLEFINELRSGPRGSGDRAYVYGAPFNYHHFIRGTIPVGTGRFRIKGAMPDPPLQTAQLLTRALDEAGIAVGRSAASHRTAGPYSGGGRQVDELTSPPLTAIVDRTNMRSVNLYAEVLLREINKAAGKADYELADTEVLTDWLDRHGIATEGAGLADGSGLSPRNYFSPAMMTDFLLTQAGNERWLESIPVAGRSGSLRNRLRGTAAEGRLRAKSGTVSGVRAYAGYIDRPDGRRLAFSIAVNNHTAPNVSTLMYGLMREMCTVGL